MKFLAASEISASAVFLAIAWFTFFLRAYSKGVVKRSFQVDDWLMVATVLIFTADCALLMRIGQYSKEEGSANLDSIVTLQIFQFAFYTLSNIILKISLTFTFRRILLAQWQRVTIYTAVTIHTVFGLATFLLMIFRCGNPVYYYSHYLEGNCVNYNIVEAVQYTNSAINTVTDWLLAILPVLALRAMKMNSQIKASALFLFVLGCVSSAVSIPRFGFIYALGGTGKQFWTSACQVAVLSIAEVGTGIAAGCLLTLRPLIKAWKDSSRSSEKGDNMSRSYSPDMAEYGQARAVKIHSYTGSYTSDDLADSLHKVKSIPPAIIVHTTKVEASPIPSPTNSKMRKRNSIRDFETMAQVAAVATANVEPEAELLTRKPTQESTQTKPWEREKEQKKRRSLLDINIKRLTWNDLHSQWTNLHASRAAYHGSATDKVKNRLTMLFPNYDCE